MSIQEGFCSFYDKQTENFKKEWQQTQATGSMESIRKMRLCVKKMRSVLRLLEKVSKGRVNARKMLKPIRSMFKKVGNIRDNQLKINLLEGYEIVLEESYLACKLFYNERLNEQLEVEAEALRGEFSEEILKKNQALVRYFFQEKYSETQVLSRLYRYLEHRIWKIHKAAANGRAEGLHQVRVWFKEVTYLLKMLHKYHWQEAMMGEHLNRYKEFARLIGEWHDKILFWESVEAWVMQHEAQREEYNRLLDVVRTEARTLELSIFKELNELILPSLNQILSTHKG